MTGLPFLLLADVEDLNGVASGTVGERVDGEPLDALHLSLLLTPARHAALEEPAELAQADGDRQPTTTPSPSARKQDTRHCPSSQLRPPAEVRPSPNTIAR